MKTIIRALEEDIIDSIRRDENLDAVSWGQEEGILISVREAQTIVAYYKEKEGTAFNRANTTKTMNNVQCPVSQFEPLVRRQNL